MATPPAAAPVPGERDELSDSLAELFTNVSLMVRGELQGSSNDLSVQEQGELPFVALLVPKWLLCYREGVAKLADISSVGTNNQLALLEKMNERVAQGYGNYGDFAAGLRVFVEQLNEKNWGFNDYVSQIDAIDQQVTEFEAVVSMIDKHVALLATKVKSAYHISSSQ